MKATRIQKWGASRYLWSALGGLALGASFPKLGIAGLAWVGPGWVLFSALGRSGGEAFRIGYVGGVAYALVAFSWLLRIPFPPGAIAGWLALSAYLGIYTGLWVRLGWRFFPAEPARVQPADSSSIKHEARSADERGLGERTPVHVLGVDLEASYFRAPLVRRGIWAFQCAAVWVALEMVLARLFTGFPWNLLGVSQYQVLPVIQIAPLTGVYGVSFLIVWFSVSLAAAALHVLADPARPRAWLEDLVVPLFAVLGVIAYGSAELAQRTGSDRTVRAVLVQPSIPQTLIWDTNQNAIRFTKLIELSDRALEATTNAQLLVWPEAALPHMLRYEKETFEAVSTLARKHRVWMVLGSDDAEPRPGGGQPDYQFFNSSFLISPDGDLAGTYRKRRLVIFGEYIPLERWLPVMKYLTPIGGSFTPGRGPSPFVIPGLNLKLSVLICFEDIFPHHSRAYVDEDTDFLLNLTNNGWFGESAAQWQHAANAVFRAVENRIPLVRCANNGLTCWVDPRGGLREVFFPGTSDVYQAGFKVFDIPLLQPGQKRTATLYRRQGDWFGWGCAGVTAMLLLRRGIAKTFARAAQARKV